MEFLIEPGLTGVVGPNGCGKSNLVEALRCFGNPAGTKSTPGALHDLFQSLFARSRGFQQNLEEFVIGLPLRSRLRRSHW